MSEFIGVEICVDDVIWRATDITFSNAALVFGVTVIGLHFTGNGTPKHLLSLMEKSVKFPVTINMPCGWSIIMPRLQSIHRNIPCPCGNGLHWIVKWDNKYQ